MDDAGRRQEGKGSRKGGKGRVEMRLRRIMEIREQKGGAVKG